MFDGVHVANGHRGKGQLTTRNQGDADVDVTPEVVHGDADEMVDENGDAASRDAAPEHFLDDPCSHTDIIFHQGTRS